MQSNPHPLENLSLMDAVFALLSDWLFLLLLAGAALASGLGYLSTYSSAFVVKALGASDSQGSVALLFPGLGSLSGLLPMALLYDVLPARGREQLLVACMVCGSLVVAVYPALYFSGSLYFGSFVSLLFTVAFFAGLP